MSETNSVVAIYETHSQAEEAVKELQRSGFDMKKMSIVGKDYHTDEHVVGYYNTGDRMKYWGKHGRLLGWSLGDVVWSRFLRHSRHRADIGSRSVGRLDRRRTGRRRCGGRIERARRGAVQHWHPQGQRREIRGGAQVRQVSPSGSWHSGRGGQGQGHPADDAPGGGCSTRGGTASNARAADSPLSAGEALRLRS